MVDKMSGREDGDERARADRTWGGEAKMKGMQITPSPNIDKQSEGKEEQEVVKTAKQPAATSDLFSRDTRVQLFHS